LTVLASVGGRPSLWRTPWGDVAPWTPSVARENTLRIVHWTIDTHDWRGDSAAKMLQATDEQLLDGAIVLAHDGIGPGARRGDARETVAYAALVADRAHRAGISLEALR